MSYEFSNRDVAITPISMLLILCNTPRPKTMRRTYTIIPVTHNRLLKLVGKLRFAPSVVSEDGYACSA